MDLFPNGGFVRLRNRARGKYVYADEDAVGVSLRPLGAAPSLNAVWKADLWPLQGGNVILLQGAAYGRYLAVAGEDKGAPSGHRGIRAVQRDFNTTSLDRSFVWRTARVEPGQNYIRLFNYLRYLRANGRHRYWNNAVTADVRSESTMMQWRVEAIPSTAVPLPLPPPPLPQPPIHVRRGLFRRRTGHGVQPHPGRTIRHVRLADDGNYLDDHWPEFVFYDNSVSNLRTQVADLEHDENITLGVRAGINALVIPLVTDLPNNVDPMEIIVYTTGSAAAAELRYPQF